MVAARVSLAATVLWLVVFALKCKWPGRRGLIPRFFVQGCLACVLPFTLLAFGQRSVDSGLTAILNSSTPVFVCLISLIWTKHEELTPGRLFGVSLGLVGTVATVGASTLYGLGHSAFGQTAIILASVVSAMSVIHGRRFADVAPEVTAAGMLTCAALVLVPACLLVETPWRSAPSLGSIAALVVNAAFATGLVFVIYFRLIQRIGSMGTASVSYLRPAVGVLVGCTLLGETLTPTAIMGSLAILFGVAAINQKGLSGVSSWLTSKLASRAAGTS
jgi:drug/metabolite transporter (DMT)-like permease